jgi:hypothetical protein
MIIYLVACLDYGETDSKRRSPNNVGQLLKTTAGPWVGESMGISNDWFTTVEYVVFRLFVLSSFVIAAVEIMGKHLKK